MVDTFRTVNPTPLALTRYKTPHRRSEKRIDPLLASPALLTHVPRLDSFIDTENTSTDLHLVSAILDLSFPALLPRPVWTVCGRFNEKERDNCDAILQLWTFWVAQNKQALSKPFHLTPWSPSLIFFFTEVTGHFHSITLTSARNIPKALEHLKTSPSSFPRQALPTFSANMMSFAWSLQKSEPRMKNCV